jgi:hypothetical protein
MVAELTMREQWPHRLPARRPERLPDSLEAPEADAWPMWEPAAPPVRQPPRQPLREFLRAVRREDSEAELALVHPDGSIRLVTRAELSAAIDALRPRQRRLCA